MAEEIVLTEDVAGLGTAGDVVTVAPGYARNYLFPGKRAIPMTSAAKKRIEKIRAERAKQEVRTLEAARVRKAELEKAGCTVPMKAGEEGRLFGAVTPSLIAETLEKQGLAVDRHQIEQEEPFREIGVFEVSVRIHPEVTAALKVWVVEE